MSAQHGRSERAHAALAVGPGHVNRPKAAFRMAKVGACLLHALEPELLAPMEQPVQPLQALLEITTHRSSISQPLVSQRLVCDTASSPKRSAFSPPRLGITARSIVPAGKRRWAPGGAC